MFTAEMIELAKVKLFGKPLQDSSVDCGSFLIVDGTDYDGLWRRWLESKGSPDA